MLEIFPALRILKFHRLFVGTKKIVLKDCKLELLLESTPVIFRRKVPLNLSISCSRVYFYYKRKSEKLNDRMFSVHKQW